MEQGRELIDLLRAPGPSPRRDKLVVGLLIFEAVIGLILLVLTVYGLFLR